MRTVDPVQWSKKVVKPPTDVARAWRARRRVDVMTALERRLRDSFCDSWAELLRNCSAAGVSSIVDERNSRPIRWCYAVLAVGALGCCTLLTLRGAGALGGRPALATALQAAPLRVQRVHFPAVALCSCNTVSATQLDSYAKYLYSLEKNNTYSMENLKRNLMAFSGLITSASLMSFDTNFTTKFLAEVARETNVTNIIYKLSPKCESMLVRCVWRGHQARCESLFALRITDVGYCCVFNARYSSEDRHNLPYRVNMAGQDYGLAVVVKENADDFTYVRRAGEELEMLIFDGTQYPLVRAGVLRAFPIQRSASVFVTLRAAVQHASDPLRYYTEAWLGCVTSHPNGEAARSWSRCVAECRRRAVLALCQCAPYSAPHALPRAPRSGDVVTCSLEHLSCLDKHKDKLTFFYPGEDAHESLSSEQANSVDCLHCRPDCARLRYTARVWNAPYYKDLKKAFYNKFLEGVRLVNSSVIRVYFSAAEQPLYLVETNLRFYEIVSLISSQWVFIAGVTVATVTQLLYHCTIRWYHHYQRRRRREYNQHIFTEFSQIKSFK